MKNTHNIFFLVAFCLEFGVGPNISATPKQLNDIMDYYLSIPDEFFNCELTAQHSQEKRSQAILYKNVASGYMKVKSEELIPIELALYKDKANEKSYLAFVYECGGGCACTKRDFLSYENGAWKNVYDELFPDMSKLTENDVNIALRLPEKGTTIIIYDYDKPETQLGELRWNRGRFDLVVK